MAFKFVELWRKKGWPIEWIRIWFFLRVANYEAQQHHISHWTQIKRWGMFYRTGLIRRNSRETLEYHFNCAWYWVSLQVLQRITSWYDYNSRSDTLWAPYHKCDQGITKWYSFHNSDPCWCPRSTLCLIFVAYMCRSDTPQKKYMFVITERRDSRQYKVLVYTCLYSYVWAAGPRGCQRCFCLTRAV